MVLFSTVSMFNYVGLQRNPVSKFFCLSAKVLTVSTSECAFAIAAPHYRTSVPKELKRLCLRNRCRTWKWGVSRLASYSVGRVVVGSDVKCHN